MVRNFAMLCSIPCILLSSSFALAASGRDFLAQAITGDNSEIALARLATMKGDRAVKEFGQTLMVDHRSARDEATALANKLGVKPPEGISNEAASENFKLEGLSGSAFDKEFATYMTEDHKKDIQKFKEEANSGAGATAELARKTLPTLEKHLAIAQKLDQGS
jgi:putative membrane protein